jgi:FKBP-type peptidyl-prolyl cis-trans isomerase (trigger factor)
MSKEHKHYSNIKIKKQKGSEVEIEGEIPTEVIEEHRTHILEEMRKDFTAPGFRKGNVPMNIFLQNVNEMIVLQEATELALNEVYPEIVRDEKIEVFGKPRITLTKLTPKNPVGFKIQVGIIPEIELPNYKNIAEKITTETEHIAVSEEEINEVVKQIKQMRATKDDGSKPVKVEDFELTDEYVKTLSAFKDVADFKAKIKENLHKDKEATVWQKKRDAIIKHLIDNSKIALPAIVVEDEANAIRERFHASLKEKNLSKEEYLKKIGKTEEELKKADISHVEQELKLRLILDKLAELENIQITDEEIEKEMEFMTARHPETDPEHLRNYIQSILRNEKLLRMLEGR